MLGGMSLAVSACGSSQPPTILNTEKVERAIEASALSQRGVHVQVSCPAGVRQKKGLTFVCTTLGGGSHTRFVVTQLDELGHVRYNAP
jgi:hypothetical protein